MTRNETNVYFEYLGVNSTPANIRQSEFIGDNLTSEGDISPLTGTLVQLTHRAAVHRSEPTRLDSSLPRAVHLHSGDGPFHISLTGHACLYLFCLIFLWTDKGEGQAKRSISKFGERATRDSRQWLSRWLLYGYSLSSHSFQVSK